MAGIVFIVFNAEATWALDFQSARTASLAQSGRGGALLTDTIFLNPSLLGFQQVQAVSGTFDWLTNPQTPAGTTNHTFNGSVIDGKNQYVNAGVAFTRRPDTDFIHVALAKRVLPYVSIGADVKRFSTGTSNPQATTQTSGFDGGLSASLALPAEMLGFAFQVGLIADNLVHNAGNEPFLGPRQLGGGLKAAFTKIMAVYGDGVVNQSNFTGSWTQFSGGMEISLGSDFYIRGGLLGFHEKGWAYGGGWIGPKIAINYGFQNRHADALRSIDHVITVDIFM